MLLNLGGNALDAMPSGGQLAFEAELAPDGEAVVIRIIDTGVGMSRETAVRIFEPFYTTKPEGQGTGLGMSVSLGIVKSHGGLLDVSSEVGRGTTMIVQLPLKSVPAAPVPNLAAPMKGEWTAAAYAALYDRVVDGFPPYEQLVERIAGLVERLNRQDRGSAPCRILDVACGTGSVVRRLAARGHVVVGVDPVGALVERARQASRGTNSCRFYSLDVARQEVPETGAPTPSSACTRSTGTRSASASSTPATRRCDPEDTPSC